MKINNYKSDSYKKPEQELLNMKTSRCTGCKSCEIACSYHHSKKFGLSESSIKIFRNNKNGEIEYFFTKSCNLCKNEQIPACVEACYTHALCLKR